MKSFNESTVATLSDIGGQQRSRLGSVVDELSKLTEATQKKLEAQRTAVDERLRQIQTESMTGAKRLREEVGNTLKGFNDSVLTGMTGMVESQNKQMAAFSEQLRKAGRYQPAKT